MAKVALPYLATPRSPDDFIKYVITEMLCDENRARHLLAWMLIQGWARYKREDDVWVQTAKAAQVLGPTIPSAVNPDLR